MIALSIGILNSRKFPFSLLFERKANTDTGTFIHGNPIAKGAWSFTQHSYNEPGYLYFNLSNTGDISTATEFGIVSSDTTGPIYTDNPTIVSPPKDGITYSIATTGTKYIRAYGQYGGEWLYSSEVTFPVQEINFTNLTVTYLGSGNYTINITAEIINPIGTVNSCGFYISDTYYTSGELEGDPYWGFGNGYTVAIDNVISVSYDHYDRYDDRRLWIRAYFTIDGVLTWSGLMNFQT